MRKAYNNFSSTLGTENYDCEISKKFSDEWFLVIHSK